jgi:tRNA threonylcarbamoyl adenosine modification protein (Sua5/YciO/YrdC/YwlC family)
LLLEAYEPCMRFELHPENPQKNIMKKIEKIFRDGGILVYPTDSGYSLGCNALDKKAVQKLYHMKRDMKKYVMAIMVARFGEIPDFAEVETSTYRYMKHLVPGPFTFILQATRHGQKILQVKRKEVGIRMPDHVFVRDLHALCDDPILNTAARINDDDLFIDPDDIEDEFGHMVDAIIDMGEVAIKPTTIVSMLTGAPEVIREGAGEI